MWEIPDVRTPEEFNTWHIGDATNIDFNNENFYNKFCNLLRIKLTCFIVIAAEDQVKLCCLCMPMALQKVYHLKDGILYWNENPQKK